MSSAHAHLPSKARAYQVTAPQKLELVETALPQYGDNDVLIKTHAISFNPVDYKVLHYNFMKLPYPQFFGADGSGVVVAVGKNVTDFKVGDDVFGSFSATNFNSGAFAEYAVYQSSRLAHKPKSLTHLEAAAIPVAGLSAYQGFVDAKPSSGQTIYIPGGAGGVGHYLVQLAKSRGLKVITSGSKPASLQYLKDIVKADLVFDYSKQNAVEAVKAATGGKGADIVLDAVYPKEYKTSIDAVKQGGVIGFLGDLVKEDSADFGSIKAKGATLIGWNLGKYWFQDDAANKKFVQGYLNDLVKEIQGGKIDTYISKVYFFKDVQKALVDLEKGSVVGKLVAQVL